MLLPVTLTVAALAGLGNLALATRIVQLRFARQVLFGDGGDARLTARTRSHANFAEYAPFVLILMALIEAGGGRASALAAAGAIFVIGRIVHAIGMEKATANPWRAAGALATWIVLLGLAIWGLALAATSARRPVAPGVPVELVPSA